MKKERTQKLLLWLIFLQFRRNGFNSERVLDSGSQLRTHQNAGPNIKITDTGLYFNFKGPLSNSAFNVEDRKRSWEQEGKSGLNFSFGIEKPDLCFKCHQEEQKEGYVETREQSVSSSRYRLFGPESTAQLL